MAKKYGNCLQKLYSTKREYAPKFKRILQRLKKSETLLNIESLLNLNENSWRFYSDYFIFFIFSVNNDLKLGTNKSKDLIRFTHEEFKADFKYFADTYWCIIQQTFARSIHEKALHHFYIENSSLQHFLENVKVKSIDEMKDFILKEAPEVYGEEHLYNFCIHLPNESNGIAVILKYGSDRNFFDIMTMKGDKYEYLTYEQNEFSKLLETVNNSPELRLCFNFIAYINCFKDCVKDGVPNDSNDKPLKNFATKSVTVSKNIESEIVGKKIAHFRHGHFRYLQSERFTNKRFTWTYVKPSMVNAEAKTIIEEE